MRFVVNLFCGFILWLPIHSQSSVEIDAFYQNIWWTCTGSDYQYAGSLLTLNDVTDCKIDNDLEFLDSFVKIPPLSTPLNISTNLGEFGALRYAIESPNSRDVVRLELIDKSASSLFTGLSVSGNLVTVSYTKENYQTLDQYSYSVKINGQTVGFSTVGFPSETAAYLKLDQLVDASDQVVFSWTKNGESQTMDVSNLGTSGGGGTGNTGGGGNNASNSGCTDSQGSPFQDNDALDRLTCYGANNKQIVVINPNVTGENWLPGCAGNVQTLMTKCGPGLYFAGEAYAERLNFITGLSPAIYGETPSRVTYDTRDTMVNFNFYKSFQMTISDQPGDFSGHYTGGFENNRVNCARLNGAPEGSIDVIDSRQSSIVNPFACVLSPGKMYYVNIRPTNEYSCTESVHCSVIIRDFIPGSGK